MKHFWHTSERAEPSASYILRTSLSRLNLGTDGSKEKNKGASLSFVFKVDGAKRNPKLRMI